MVIIERNSTMATFVRNAVRALILLNAVWLLVAAPLYAASNSLTITNSVGITTNNYPVQIGRPFVQGEIPNGQLPQAVIGGTAVNTQVDVKNRWPDNSLKYAVLSFMIPTFAANTTYTVALAAGSAAGNTALTQAQMLDTGVNCSTSSCYNFDARILFNGVSKASARTMLSNGDYTVWASGPVATTIILANDAQTTTCNSKAASTYDFGLDAFCPLRPRFEATFWPTTHQVWVRYVLENTSTEQFENVTVTNLTLTLGNTSPATIYPVSGTKSFTQTAGSRWTIASPESPRVTAQGTWINGTPPIADLKANLSYLSATNLVPNYDTTKSLSAGVITNSYTDWQNGSFGNSGITGDDLYQSGNWISNGSCCDISSGGGHDHIGPVPSWIARWLYSGDHRMAQQSLNNADLAGAFPYHFREGNSSKNILSNGVDGYAGSNVSGVGHVVAMTNRASLAYTATGSGFIGGASNNGSAFQAVGTTSGQGFSADPAHKPVFFTEYLLSGDPYYLDEMYFWEGWAAWYAANPGCPAGNNLTCRGPSNVEGGIPDRNDQNYQMRGQGWTFLGRVRVAAISPDSSPEHTYFTNLTNDAISRFEGERGIITGIGHTTGALACADGAGSTCNTMWNFGYNVSGLGAGLAVGQFDPGLHQWQTFDTSIYVGLPPLRFWGISNAAFCQPTQTTFIDQTVSRSCIAPWMQDYVVISLGVAKELGFSTSALLAWVSPALINPGIGTDGFNPYLASSYHMPVVNINSAFFPNWSAANGVLGGYLVTSTNPNGTPVQAETSFFPGNNQSGDEFTSDGNTQPYAAAVSFVADQTNGALAWNWANTKIESVIVGTQTTNPMSDLKWAILPRAGGAPPSGGVPPSGGTALTITTNSTLPTGTTGTSYSQALAAMGGTSPYNWRVTAGSLPPGLSLSTAGAVSGTPTVAGTANFTIQVQDSASNTGSQAFSLVVIGTVTSGGLCDLTMDGVVNSLDVQFAINQVLGVTPCSNADLLQTGQCNVVDVQRVINAALGGACLTGSGSGTGTGTGTGGSDTTPPTVSLTAPQAGATIAGIVTILANATDNVAVAGVQFKLDGVNLGNVVPGTGPAYNIAWDTTISVDGSHTLIAVATDTSGNSAQSAPVSVTVKNGTTVSGGPFPVGWTSLANTTLKSVCPPTLASNCQYVISAWSGGIADTKRNRLIIWGGGHGDYYGNEIYSLNLNSNPVTLTRLNNPSPINSTPSVCPAALSDGNPNSRHTYDGLAYMNNVDKMFAFGGSVACNAGQHLEDLWTLDLPTLQWQRMDPANGSQQPSSFYTPVPNIAAYDPNTASVFLSDTAQLWNYDYGTNSYTYLNGSANVPYNSTGVIDPTRKLFFIMGNDTIGGTGRMSVIDISSGSNYAVQQWTSTGCSGLLNSEAPGLAYDSALDRIVGWPNFGNTVYIFDPSTKSCTTQTFPGGPPNSLDYNGNPATTGTFGRFQYFPSLNAFAVVNFWTNNAYILKLN